ncbi:putative nucleotidyltransferase [Hyphomonas polymorpha PS728]|uniref:Putative nucleotidyltransferase n=1 Tax=Hyphomonas polymorpha PS728 TaxID=1280954 RepID=A0A062VGQ5_9PROT|nr:HEPN domain-containing protein [Hyphomonas polymorpha]KCZ99603.1 putative nucleotidyltransferase [Hyphomonas polymorpha PS728]
MQTSLDHLPPARQAEFARIQEVILDELETRIKADGKARAKHYRLLKLVLFGSFAKGTWFEDSRSGRASDIDLLAIVSHEALTEMSAFWGEVEDRLYTDPLVKRDVSIIVHTLQDVNRQLKDGQYFFSEIIQQGILLYEDGEPDRNGNAKNILAKPAAPDPKKAYYQAAEYASYWKRAAEQFLTIGRQGIDAGPEWERNTAFQLHQAAESAYRMFLLTTTLYAPGTHHLGKLRNIARTIDGRIEDSWGPPQKPYKRYFELLRRAYVEARYSPSYETTQEILTWQADRIGQLIAIANELCRERLERLGAEAESGV